MNNKVTSLSFRKDFQKPEEENDRTLGFVKWGKKNDYPFFLIDLYNGSAWHQGIVKTKCFYIAGSGLEIVSGDMQSFIDNKYSDFNMNEISEMLAFDGELFGSFAVKGTWNREGTRVAMWENVAIDKMRTSEDERMYYLSDDWTAQNQSPEKTNLRMYPALDMNSRAGSFIIYVKEPSKKSRKEKGVYAKPSYYGGITAIQTDVDIAKFHMYELQNGFKSGTLINMPSGYPETTEELNRIKSEIKGRTQSVEDAGEIIITFSDGKDLAPEVSSLNGNDLDKRYQVTEVSVQQNILVAHSVTAPNLFGVKSEGSFNSAESSDLFEIFKKTYVNSKQKRIEWLLNYMAELGGYIGAVKLVDVQPLTSTQVIDTPAITSTPTTATDPTLAPATDVSKSALNGSQITSLIDVTAQIKSGLISQDSALAIILASFPTIDDATARRIVGLPTTALSMCNHETFSIDEIGVFSEFGENQDNYIVLSSKPIAWNTLASDVFARQEQLFATIGEIKLTMKDFDKNVLKMVQSGEDSVAISKALKVNIQSVAEAMNRLSKWELIKKGELTDLGDSLMKDIEIQISDFEVRYTYRTRLDVPEPLTQSRAFCQKLMDLRRSYSREDINSISARVDRNVWNYKGGYYTNPDTQVTTPWCRHEWLQQIVIKQK